MASSTPAPAEEPTPVAEPTLIDPPGIVREIPTAEQIAGAISAMRDSVWVVNSEMEKEEVTQQVLDAIGRNVAHLELQMGNEHISGADDDLSDVEAAITAGKAFLEEHS